MTSPDPASLGTPIWVEPFSCHQVEALISQIDVSSIEFLFLFGWAPIAEEFSVVIVSYTTCIGCIREKIMFLAPSP